MNSTTRFTTGVYKGKTYEEVYEILQTTDKSFLKKLKGTLFLFRYKGGAVGARLV